MIGGPYEEDDDVGGLECVVNVMVVPHDARKLADAGSEGASSQQGQTVRRVRKTEDVVPPGSGPSASRREGEVHPQRRQGNATTSLRLIIKFTVDAARVAAGRAAEFYLHQKAWFWNPGREQADRM